MCWGNRIISDWHFVSHTHGLPGALLQSLQVVAAALDAAKHRRERLVSMHSLATPSTVRSGSKRTSSQKKEGDVTSSASTSAASCEKVTPDPKHIRTNDVVEPKVLFATPTGPAGDDVAMDPAHEGTGDQTRSGWCLSQNKYHQVII